MEQLFNFDSNTFSPNFGFIEEREDLEESGFFTLPETAEELPIEWTTLEEK